MIWPPVMTVEAGLQEAPDAAVVIDEAVAMFLTRYESALQVPPIKRTPSTGKALEDTITD